MFHDIGFCQLLISIIGNFCFRSILTRAIHLAPSNLPYVRRQRFFANLCKLTTRGCSVTPALQPRGGSAAAAGKFEGTLKYKHRNRCSVWPPKPDCIITSQKYLTYFLYRVSFNNFENLLH